MSAAEPTPSKRRSTRKAKGSCLKRVREEVEEHAPVVAAALDQAAHRSGLTLALKAGLVMLHSQAEILEMEVPAAFEEELFALALKYGLLGTK